MIIYYLAREPRVDLILLREFHVGATACRHVGLRDSIRITFCDVILAVHLPLCSSLTIL